MDRPLEIAFHNCQHSDAVEDEIRKHVDRLEKRFPQLVACRVSIEALHNQHQTGNVWEVHIVLSIPGKDLAVSREPNRAKEKYAHPNIHSSLRDAFRLPSGSWKATRSASARTRRRRAPPRSPARSPKCFRTPITASS